MIAMAIANDPDVLIADEPTTALDVTIQAQVLEVLERIQERPDAAIVLITHDLGVVAGSPTGDRDVRAARRSSSATSTTIFYEPRHPYTLGLLGVAAAPRRADERAAATDQGPAAVAHLPAAGLRVPSAVLRSPGPSAVPRGRARAAADRRRRPRRRRATSPRSSIGAAMSRLAEPTPTSARRA